MGCIDITYCANPINTAACQKCHYFMNDATRKNYGHLASMANRRTHDCVKRDKPKENSKK